MSSSLDMPARRLLLGMLLTRRAAKCAGGRVVAESKEDLLALACRLARDVDSIERAYDFHCQPSYPGVTSGPEAVGDNLRLVLACHARQGDGTPLGVVFTTLITGRRPQVSVAPTQALIPASGNR